MQKYLLITLVFLTFFSKQLLSQKKNEETKKKNKTGWNLGGLPAISYNSDLGFQYGGLVNLYDYGNGKKYPKYNHSIYIEVSRFTKGSGINRVFYDSERLLKKIRITSDLSYMTDKALDFYGFNGYKSVYDADWEDDDHSDYRSRVFYRHERKFLRFITDLQGRLSGKKVKWIAGLGFYRFDIGPVDINALNKGMDAGSLLPDIPGLYDLYVQWGIIPQDESDGGRVNFLKMGVAYDTRDNYPNPMKGIWTEAIITTTPGFFGNDFSFSKLALTHRQYFTLIPDDLSFVYRIGYQRTIQGHAPFFIQPEIITTYLTAATSEGLGGSRSLRGVLRNRVVGDGFMYGNFEFRWKFLRTRAFNQNIYLALNIFMDVGKVMEEIYVDPDIVQSIANATDYFSDQKDKIHKSFGAGLRVAMNENFIVAVDYGQASDSRDGKSGLYIALNYLF